MEHLSIQQVAQTLGVSEKSIRRYVKSGRIKASLVRGMKGDEYRIDSSELKSFQAPPRGKRAHKSHLDSKKSASQTKDLSSEKNYGAKISNNKSQITNKTQNDKDPDRGDTNKITSYQDNNLSSIKNILEEKIKNLAESQNSQASLFNYQGLYEKLLSKYEQSLIMIGSLEAQLRFKTERDRVRFEELKVVIQKQEDLILELYQIIELYRGQNPKHQITNYK